MQAGIAGEHLPGATRRGVALQDAGNVFAQAIDESTLQEQEGTLAGDNTLLVLFADEARLERWRARFEAIGAGASPSLIPEVPYS